jgi:hypothetical protein
VVVVGFIKKLKLSLLSSTNQFVPLETTLTQQLRGIIKLVVLLPNFPKKLLPPVADKEKL